MGRLYINTTLEKSIRSYCNLNGIEDINAFANRCAMQGFNIIKFGMSPKDNIEREITELKILRKMQHEKKKKTLLDKMLENKQNKNNNLLED